MSTRRRLSQLLLASHIGLVLLFAVLLLATGVGTIRSAVVGQARTEAERAVSEARQRLVEWQHELNVGANLLAEQPTLRFYLQRGQLTKARTLVKNFHGTSAIGYIRVQVAGRTVAEFGTPPPSFTTGLIFDRKGRAWRVVQRDIRMATPASVVVAERIGNRLNVRPSGDQVIAELLPMTAAQIATGNPWSRPLREVAATGEPETFEKISNNAAARIAVFRDDAGEPAAMLTARVEQDWVERRIFEWLAAFGLSSLVTCVLALALAVLLAA